MNSIPLKLNDGKRVGEIVGDRAVLQVTSRNYLGLAHGYSLDGQVLRTIINAGCQLLEFHNTKSGRRFRVSVDEFQASAKPYNFGYGEKWAAPDSIYAIISPGSSGAGLSNLYA